VLGDTTLLEICNQRIELIEGEYSNWISLAFRMGLGAQANGICRVLLRRCTPDIELYISPIHIDPERAALPVSHPAVYATYLAKRLGRFGTLGLAEDTWALNEGVLDDKTFFDQCKLFLSEREQMLHNALDTVRSGCVICVFDTTDRVQHMYWRYRDPEHPAPLEADKGPFRTAIETTYEQADAVAGATLERMTAKDALFVMSDHGFTSFRRGVNLNVWFQQNGYLALKDGTTGTADWLSDVDWSKTQAYALGLAGIYLNVTGRESEGIVAPDDVQTIKEELIGRLSGLCDQEKEVIAINRVFDPSVVSPGPYVDQGPDLIIGYMPGYRTSWDAARGRMSDSVFEDNTRRWSGDHCVDPRYVPGILFSNRRITATTPRITDMAPTILSLFGVSAPAYMQGRSLEVHDGKGSVTDA
jgi:predicted AlkP superfamily phosphohydrolase/phosphomutase